MGTYLLTINAHRHFLIVLPMCVHNIAHSPQKRPHDFQKSAKINNRPQQHNSLPWAITLHRNNQFTKQLKIPFFIHFIMELRGVEPLSENSSTRTSSITVAVL